MLSCQEGNYLTKKIIFLALCIIFLAVLLPHVLFLENKFIDGDDLTRIVQNPLIRNISLVGFARGIKGFFSYRYPSFLLTYFWGLIFSVWELNHIGFHFVSFLLHALCSSLLFLLLSCFIIQHCITVNISALNINFFRQFIVVKILFVASCIFFFANPLKTVFPNNSFF